VRGGGAKRSRGGPPREGRPKDGGGGASQAWRQAVDAQRPDRAKEPRVPKDLETWVLVEEIRDEAEHAVERATTAPTQRERDQHAKKRAADETVFKKQLGQAVGPSQSEKIEKRLRVAARDFEAERFPEAAKRLRPLADRAPSVAAVRELYGLTLYRQGKWKLAAKELEAFRTLSGSTEQHPVLADCYRALHRWKRVEELWDELRQESPSGELVTEGRIVMAGSMADRGDVRGAIQLLEQGWRFPKRAKAHHLRRAYALADLYERAGDVGRARELFGRIRAADPSFADVGSRMRTLG
jgi:tetratricopeptide (TPR) repeat protein